MRFFEFLNDVDWSKNIILFIIYMAVVLFCILLYLTPIIQNHRIQMLDYKKIQNLDYTISNNTEIFKSNLQAMEKKNQDIYKDMRNELNINDLQKYISKFLSNAKILDGGISIDDNSIKTHTIHISGEVKSTKNIMALMDSLTKLNNSIRIGFPINITKHNNLLKVEFAIVVYNSTYQF